MTDTSSAAGDDVAAMGPNSGDTVRGQESDTTHPDLPYADDDASGDAATGAIGGSGGDSTDAVDDGTNVGLGDMDDVVPGAGAIEPPD